MPPRTPEKFGPLLIRAETGRFLAPADVGGRIENMVQTEEGTLRTISGPCPFLPSYGRVGAPTVGLAPASGSAAEVSLPTYGPMHGVFHARVGARDITLIHTGDQVWEFEGFNRGWRVLIGASATSPLYEADVIDDDRPRFPTQFEATTSGIVIVPQDGRAYFYDGSVVLPLGFDRAPGAPVGMGPLASGTTTPNNRGYAHDRNPDSPWTGNTSATEMLFGSCKIGTIEGIPTADYENAGVLLNGQWNAAVQWVDRWGNLSPLSPRSNPVEMARQRSADPSGTLHSGDTVRKQIAWTNINRGPAGTVGRVIYRSKDILHSGTTQLFEVPPDVIGAEGAFATLPDNITEFYPDNVPDGALLRAGDEPVAVPTFRLCRAAFGRMWIANTAADPGMVRWSMPGRWGTFLRDDVVWPDTSGSEVTGLWRTALGLLLFTESSTFLIVPNDSGDGFKVATVHAEIGCVAPDSVRTMPSGLTVWLGREGFYAWDGEAVALISDPVARTLRAVNRSRRRAAVAAVDPKSGEYRCWIPVDGSKVNNLCLVFTGREWRRRTDTYAASVCVRRDHTQYMIAAGQSTAGAHGVWVLDHETPQYEQRHVAVLETAWIEAGSSEARRTPLQVRLFLVEEQQRSLKVEVMRDWRETVIETQSTTADPAVLLYPDEDAPAFWNVTLLGATDAEWKRRRPFWRRLHIYVPSCEVFKIRISSPEVPEGTQASAVSTRWEFVGMQIDGVSHDQTAGRMSP